MPAAHDWKKQLDRLSALKSNYTSAATGEKINLLRQLYKSPLADTSFIKSYHNHLLFLCSQPDNSIVYQQALEGLEK